MPILSLSVRRSNLFGIVQSAVPETNVSCTSLAVQKSAVPETNVSCTSLAVQMGRPKMVRPNYDRTTYTHSIKRRGPRPLGPRRNRWAACASRQSFFATDWPSDYWRKKTKVIPFRTLCADIDG